MSQHDFNIANQTFPSFRSDLNDALQAAATISAGATAPTTPYAYQLWYDTANEKYMIRNAANSAWLNFVGIDTNGNVDVTGAITTDGLTSEAANGTITSKASGSSFCSFTANTSAGNNAYVFFQQAGTEMSRITAYNGDVLAFSTGSGAAERMRITGGNLLVGTTSYDGSHFNDTSGGGFAVTSAGKIDMKVNGTVANFNRTSTSDGDILYFAKQGASVGSIAVSSGDNLQILGAATNHAGFEFGTNLVIPKSNGATADGAIDLGFSSGRFSNLYLSGGVYLGGTGSANYLDDYEEGTWTPVIQDSSGNSSSTAASQSYYTKIGRQVTVTASLVNFDTTGLLAGDDLRIYGFPFQSDGTSVGSAVVNYLSTTSTDQTNSVYSYMPNNNTYVTIYETRRNASGLSSNVSAFTSGFADIYLTHTYFTD